MTPLWLFLWLIGWGWRSLDTPQPPVTPTPALAVAILDLRPGQAVQGVLAVRVKSDVPAFRNAELSFTYQDDPRQTWFLVAESNQPLNGQSMAEWDTNTISDGDYLLRLVVWREEGNYLEAIVPLRVRNYSPIETDTPLPPTPSPTLAPAETPIPTVTATAHPPPAATSTSLPPNPLALQPAQVIHGAVQGGAIAILALAMAGLYARLRLRGRP